MMNPNDLLQDSTNFRS